MVETRGAEVLAQAVADALLLPEDDAQQDTAALAVEAARNGPCQPAVNPVAESAEAVAMPDDPPAVSRQHDVDAATLEPGSLVESVTGAAGKLGLRPYLEHSALRGSSAEWQLQLGGLVEREQPEPPDADWQLQVEPPAPWCRGHDDQRRLGATDLRKQGAAIESVEPGASPPPARQGEDARDCPDRLPRAPGKDDRRSTSERHERRQSDEVRERESQTERGKQGVRRRTERSRNQGATRSLSWSSRAGPIPGTASSSSTDVNAPCF